LVGVISLGCDKNRVDTEKALAVLKLKHRLTADIERAQVVLINTCAFLESSRKEAVDEILQVAQLKECGALEKIIVSGCLPQKFCDEIFDALPEVDAFMGVSDYGEINAVIDRIYDGERVKLVGEPRGECGIERVQTTKDYAYLKIADGCSNHCTYCLIPKIRGKYRSVPLDSLIEETKLLGEVKELILVAQDLTRYGQDFGDGTNLLTLIRALSNLKTVKGIRLLYCYPEGVTDELIHEFATNPKMIRYIDVPFQHASDRILKLMNRRGSFDEYLALVEKLKSRVSGIAVRSTFIAGFPGETEEDFEKLKEFLLRAKLFNAGFFAYSREEQTPSDKLGGHLPKKVRTARQKKLYTVQKKVVRENYAEMIGKSFAVTVEGFDTDELVYYGRAYFFAPEIDGKIKFFAKEETNVGDVVNVKILKAFGYELYGERQ